MTSIKMTKKLYYFLHNFLVIIVSNFLLRFSSIFSLYYGLKLLLTEPLELSLYSERSEDGVVVDRWYGIGLLRALVSSIDCINGLENINKN